MGVYIPTFKPTSCNKCPFTCEALQFFNGKDRPQSCPLIEIVQCKDCKYYDTESRSFPCCTDIFGAVRYMEADGFCSKGERKGK